MVDCLDRAHIARVVHAQVRAPGVTSLLPNSLGNHPQHSGGLARPVSATLDSLVRPVCVSATRCLCRLEPAFRPSGPEFYALPQFRVPSRSYIHGNADERSEISVPYLGAIEETERIISSVAIDILILADLDYDRERIFELADACEREMVEFKVVPSYFQILVSGLHLETISGIPVLGVSRLPLDRIVSRATKRMIDIVGGAVGIVLSLPIIVIFGAIVYSESPGPIFYRQRRSGRNGKPFDIFKIRSMRLDAEPDGKVGWTIQNDPRRLRIGAFMRKWNIDEVPQFWNVVKGEMSLVGPRPERPELVARFKHDVPHYNARHNAKPGITGWAQIHGLRGNTDLAERINYDVWYMENWSLILDFQIMAMTFFKGQNAG